MTIAHWCLPLGVSLEALEELTAWVPAATATPTAVSFRNSRRLIFFLLIIFLAVVFDSSLIPAFQPGSQHHTARKTDQTRQGGESQWSNGSRFRGDRGGFDFRRRLDRDGLCGGCRAYRFCCTMHLLGMARVAGF